MNIVMLLLARHTNAKSESTVIIFFLQSAESLLSIYENMHCFLSNLLWANKKLKEII